MNELFFWKYWNPKDRLLFYLFLILFSLSALYYIITNFIGEHFALHWGIINHIEALPITVYEIWTDIQSWQIKGDNYTNLQEFIGKELQIIPLHSYLLLISMIFSITGIFTVITTLKRFWFLIAVGIMILSFTTLNLENLELFGQVNKLGLVIFIFSYSVPAYFFQAIMPNFGIFVRFFTFWVLTLLLVVFIFLFAEVSQPLMHFVNFGLPLPFLLAVVFIFLVAHDLVSFFLRIITNSNNEFSKNSDLHFVIISALYLISLLLIYLHNIQVFDWSILYINPFIILLVSAIVGLWEFRKRLESYQGVFSSESLAMLLYLSLGLVCFSTISYFFSTANDPAIESLEDTILLSHFGFGLGFFLYVLVNFFTILHENYTVYKVVYKPTKMPYFTARLAGVVVVLAFFLQANSIAYNQARSACYNAIGNVYDVINNNRLAQEYYNEGRIYGYKNHHSNYGLAHLALENNDPSLAAYYFDQATQKKPTPYAYVNLSNIYKNNGKFFQAMFTLQDGLKIFPENGPMKNNLGLLFSETNVVDSTLYFLEAAGEDTQAKSASISNQSAIYAIHQLDFPLDSILNLYHSTDDLVNKSNLLILLNLSSDSPVNIPFPYQADTLLSINQYVYLNNYLAYQLQLVDSADLSLFSNYIDNAQTFFRESLDFNRALVEYANQNLFESISQLNELSRNSKNAEKYYHLLGSISLKENAPRLAMDYANEAFRAGDSTAILIQAISDLQVRKWSEMNQKIMESSQFFKQQLPVLLKLVEYKESNTSRVLTDSLKYVLSSYQNQRDLIDQIDDQNLKAVAISKYLNDLMTQNHFSAIEDFLEIVDGLAPLNRNVNQLILLTKLRYYYLVQDFDALSQLVASINSDQQPQLEIPQLYYQAKLAEINNNSKQASALYHLILRKSPFHEKAFTEAIDYLYTRGEDESALYDRLVKAINFNPYSLEINKTYLRYALEIGLDGYAKEALQEFTTVSDPENSKILQNYYDSLLRIQSEPTF